MSTSIEEINVRCPACGMNVFEAVDSNGNCMYCGEQIEDDDIIEGVL